MVCDSYSVDVDNKECVCRLWQLSGIPCTHDISAINFLNDDPQNHVNYWFSVHNFKEAYKNAIKPMNGSKMWPVTEYSKPLPPKERQMPGRPSIKRKRHESERQGGYKKVSGVGRVMTCSNCQGKGHNARFCKNKKTSGEAKPPRSRGRPRSSHVITRRKDGRGGGAGGRRENAGRCGAAGGSRANAGRCDAAGGSGANVGRCGVAGGSRANTGRSATITVEEIQPNDTQQQESQSLEPSELEAAESQIQPHHDELAPTPKKKSCVPPFVKLQQRSQRIIKNKLKKPFNFGPDRGGSTTQNALQLD